MRKEKLEELKKIINEFKTVSYVVNDNPKKRFIGSIPYLFTLNNGKVIPREQLLKNNLDGSAVMIAAQDKESKEFLFLYLYNIFHH